MLHNAGRDWAASSMFDRSPARAATADYIAVSASTVPPAAGDTTLAGEIATAGLGRRQATWAHTAGAATSTLTATFVATAADALPVTLAKAAVLNAAAGGVMPFSEVLSAPAPLNLVNDAVTITVTVTHA
ncbi:hypothetical protein [Actinoplanes derwentensis]|uniref:Uncharacterized protein n=1 Tax=Actinoplanes derwentensis TaxID=113562 RepID=A0A1H2CV03_9ACTN|nr:hypothetical protein [Actinoplanes derwentensis]GID82011.1 hypothetical protein Ade03nite_09350 [Actinoplanes derwentensis]SDT74358.1 hypothetical protein SAMN04489716_6957 [Actinoplanes derwentensis]